MMGGGEGQDEQQSTTTAAFNEATRVCSTLILAFKSPCDCTLFRAARNAMTSLGTTAPPNMGITHPGMHEVMASNSKHRACKEGSNSYEPNTFFVVRVHR